MKYLFITLFAVLGFITASLGGYTCVDKKLPPQNIEAEQSVLGGILLDNEALDRVSWLKETDFYEPWHGAVYGAMLSLWEAGRPIDYVTLEAELKRRKIGHDPLAVSNLAHGTPTAANIYHYAAEVQNKALLRLSIAAGGQIAEAAGAPGARPDDVLERAEALFSGITRKDTGKLWTTQEVAAATMRWLEEMQARGDGMTGVPTGLIEIDNVLQGLQPTDLILLAARPSMGKTSLALNIAQHAAGMNFPVCFFSLEMSKEQLGLRALSTLSGVPSGVLKSAFISQQNLQALANANANFSALPMEIDETGGITLRDLRSKARRFARKHREELGLIVVDYIQIMGTGRSENRTQAIGELSKGLKNLAKELGWPVLALSQLNRDVENRTADGCVPRLSDLRDSGSLEQDADLVTFLYRPVHYFDEITKHPDKAAFVQRMIAQEQYERLNMFIIAKNRNGPTPAPIWLDFDRTLTRFSDFINGPKQEEII